MKELQEKTPIQQSPEVSQSAQPGERIVTDLLERIRNRELSEAGELSWSDHSETYTEWSRQR